MAFGAGGVDTVVDGLGRVVPADQGHRQPVGMGHVVEAEAALDAEPVLVGRPGPALDGGDFAGADPVGHLAADAAIGADAVHLVQVIGQADAPIVEQGGFHEGAGGAGLHAFAAGDAGAHPHGVVEIKDDLGFRAAPGHADDVVHLNLAASADAKGAMDAGVQVDRHGGMAGVRHRGGTGREAAFHDAHLSGPVPEQGTRLVGRVGRRLVGEQHFEHHVAGRYGAFGRGQDGHAFGGHADAACCQHPFALDFDHAGAAVAIGPVAGLRRITKMRNLHALALGYLPDGLVGGRLDLAAVQGKFDFIAHICIQGLVLLTNNIIGEVLQHHF